MERTGVSEGFKQLLLILLVGLVGAGALWGAEGQNPEDQPEAAIATDNAVLRPGDVVKLTVWNEPDLNVKSEINEDGSVVLPYIGPTQAAGKKPSELQDVVEAKYADGYLVNPQVYISVASRTSSRVYVVGAVGRPGVYDLAEKTTLLELLARCGGAQAANGHKVMVIRQGGMPGGSEPEGAPKKAPARVSVDLPRLLQGDLSQNVKLQNRDVVLFTQSRGALEEIFILGDVSKKGSYPLRDDMSLSKLLASIGLGPENKKATLTVLRESPNNVERHVFSVKEIFLGNEGHDFELESGDVVNIERESDVYYVVGEVNSAGAYRFQEGLTIREALILAGWITRRGNLGNIEVMRQRNDKWVTEKGELTDTVQSGDVIKVQERWF